MSWWTYSKQWRTFVRRYKIQLADLRLLCLTAILIASICGAAFVLGLREYGQLVGPEAMLRVQMKVLELNGQKFEELQR